MSFCNAPNSCRCDHKRNCAAKGVNKCAIDADKKTCIHSFPAAELIQKINAAEIGD